MRAKPICSSLYPAAICLGKDDFILLGLATRFAIILTCQSSYSGNDSSIEGSSTNVFLIYQLVHNIVVGMEAAQ